MFADRSEQLSLKYFREHEYIIDERVMKLCASLRRNFAHSGTIFDFSEWARYASLTQDHCVAWPPLSTCKPGLLTFVYSDGF